jgi:hypothetical protein
MTREGFHRRAPSRQVESTHPDSAISIRITRARSYNGFWVQLAVLAASCVGRLGCAAWIPQNQQRMGFALNSLDRVLAPSGSYYRLQLLRDSRLPGRALKPCARESLYLAGDGWDSFASGASMMDDDIDLEMAIDTTSYANENDDSSIKAAVGDTVKAPIIENPSPDGPLYVSPGSRLEMSEDTVLGVLDACRYELGTLFGYSAENRGVGITGGVEYVDSEGPVVTVRLKGRFWHQRTTVLQRVANYLQQRIPEITDVAIEDPYQLTDEANNDAL